MYKYIMLAAISLMLTSAKADESKISFGIVNYEQCINDSKFGKLEQRNFEAVRKQMISKIEDTEKELREISEKKKDTEYMDGLSPKAEEELDQKYQTLSEDMNRLQGQYYQLIQQGQYQIGMKVFQNIEQASKQVADQKDLQLVLGKSLIFYQDPDLDITSDIIVQMDKTYDIDLKDGKISEAPIPDMMTPPNVSKNENND